MHKDSMGLKVDLEAGKGSMPLSHQTQPPQGQKQLSPISQDEPIFFSRTQSGQKQLSPISQDEPITGKHQQRGGAGSRMSSFLRFWPHRVTRSGSQKKICNI